MSFHRADKHRVSEATPANNASRSSASKPGHRRADSSAKPRTAASASSLLGGAALIVAAVGAATAGQAISGSNDTLTHTASRHEGAYVAKLSAASISGRNVVSVSRASDRPSLDDNNALQDAAQANADARSKSLEASAAEAKEYADAIEAAERREARKDARKAARQAAESDASDTTTSPEAPAPVAVVSSSGWVVPTSDYYISTWFGEAGSYWSSGYHTGVDLATAYGTPVVAVTNSTVVQTGYDGAYGNQIRIQLSNGDQIWYNHLSAIEVTVGQTLSTGQAIGRVGETGNAYGAHLHLEYRLASDLGTGVDPVPYFAAQGISL